MTYDENVIECFKALIKKQGSTSPAEVTQLMREKEWLSKHDTVINIVGIMKRLRHQEGRL